MRNGTGKKTNVTNHVFSAQKKACERGGKFLVENGTRLTNSFKYLKSHLSDKDKYHLLQLNHDDALKAQNNSAFWASSAISLWLTQHHEAMYQYLRPIIINSIPISISPR